MLNAQQRTSDGLAVAEGGVYWNYDWRLTRVFGVDRVAQDGTVWFTCVDPYTGQRMASMDGSRLATRVRSSNGFFNGWSAAVTAYAAGQTTP